MQVTTINTLSATKRLACGIGTLVTLPMLLAWLAGQWLMATGLAVPVGTAHQFERPSPITLLLLGPLFETVLLIIAAAIVTRILDRYRIGRSNLIPCTGIIAFSFVASHWLQNGTPVLASLPMASVLAVHTPRLRCMQRKTAFGSISFLFFMRCTLFTMRHCL